MSVIMKAPEHYVSFSIPHSGFPAIDNCILIVDGEYQAEGNSKANELTAMIANAKATIREQYPDEG